MAALATTITVLGAVALFEPVNGYQLRRELLSWQMDEWAQVKPGSIYSMLTTLTRDGYVVRHDLDDEGRAVAVYTTSPAGQARLRRLLCRALSDVDPLSPLPFHVAVMLQNLLSRDEAELCLARRLEALRLMAHDLRVKLEVMSQGNTSPPHVLHVVDLSLRLVATDEAWAVEHLSRVRAGAFGFAGEDDPWRPADDDPGWQMAAEREHYRRLLDR
ncbi:MAG: PadR family transcriptional regulator [Kineosporiaceae bacterium]|jgi:DNA-binding PadR family transcriptional regulator